MNSLAPSLFRQPHVSHGEITLCQVLLGDLEVMADIGAFAAEHGVLQPLNIHVTLTIAPPTADDLAETFDYNQIRAHALELAGQRISLIETFAQRLARACLDAPMVTEAEVRIDKPRAVPGCMAGTRVVLGKA
ncbi:dihydroneopterin aldolase [Novosphingobium terrae]|uniref:dihydroneopterin aldolase n=1 Tax=Novosphingobium terrae TaxID=2726189 RepID=UPI001981B64C|nr:dihydroneopterin aldolase [Novosphingobium terrae]